MLSEFELLTPSLPVLVIALLENGLRWAPGTMRRHPATPGLSQLPPSTLCCQMCTFPSCASPAYWLPLAYGVFFGFGSHGRDSAILLGLIVHGQSQAARDSVWVETLAQGMAAAAKELGVYVCGGNCRAVR